MRSKHKKSKTYHIADIYQEYAKKLLKENPEYWSLYNKPAKMSNYQVFCKGENCVKEIISYPVFRRIFEVYYSEAKEHIIAGEELNLGNRNGVIAARRVERNHKKRMINYGETRKQPKNEKGKPARIIYWTNDDWCRIGWKKSGKVKNQRFYKFKPTRAGREDKSGFVEEFKRALDADPMLKYRYKYYPYIVDRNEDNE